MLVRALRISHRLSTWSPMGMVPPLHFHFRAFYKGEEGRREFEAWNEKQRRDISDKAP